MNNVNYLFYKVIPFSIASFAPKSVKIPGGPRGQKQVSKESSSQSLCHEQQPQDQTTQAAGTLHT